MADKDIELDDVIDVELETQNEVEHPSMYAVILHNDDYTPAEYVQYILVEYFKMDSAAANQTTWRIHLNGKGVVGIYPKDIAETKSQQVNDDARSQGYPLTTTIEKQD